MAASEEQCPICQEDLKDPRLLPCIHSFCLECLEQYCVDKLPGDDVECPVCRNEFQIPKNRVAGLPVRTHGQEPFGAYKLGRGSYCKRHQERVKMYCFDCVVNVCAMCCLEDHKTHKYEQIEEIVDRFSRSIDEEIQRVTSRMQPFRCAAARLTTESNKALNDIKTMELEVKKRCEEIKQLADRQESELLQKLQLLKSAEEKEAKLHKDELELALSEMETFRTSSSELKSKGSPSDITQAANDIHQRARELLQTHVIPSEYHASSYKFTPVNIDELLRDDQNFIGHVVAVTDSGN